jgi:hypothetical protein
LPEPCSIFNLLQLGISIVSSKYRPEDCYVQWYPMSLGYKYLEICPKTVTWFICET